MIVIIQLLALRERRQKARDAESSAVESDDGKDGSVGEGDKKGAFVATEERRGDEKSISL